MKNFKNKKYCPIYCPLCGCKIKIYNIQTKRDVDYIYMPTENKTNTIIDPHLHKNIYGICQSCGEQFEIHAYGPTNLIRCEK